VRPPLRRPTGHHDPQGGRSDGRSNNARDDLAGDQVEGLQAVRELLIARRREVFDLYVSDDDGRSGPITEIVRLAAGSGVLVRHVSIAEIRRLAGSEVPQGVVAFAQRIAPVTLASLAKVSKPTPFLVVLDGVTDPQNLGAVMRSALSAGATGAVIPRHNAVRLTPSAVKAAAGAVEYLPIALVPGVPAALQALHAEGVWSVGLDGSGTTDIDDVALFEEPVALVLGAEGAGLAPLTRQRCDVIAQIEMHGPLGSLNVSAAGAVACFAVARRRRLARGGDQSLG
jgi:23S rRNA (guanosine2251-2'-O)-methyltransferase